MGGIELQGDTLLVHREPNNLDDLAVRFSEILTEFGIAHVFVSGYVAILTGRSRATEDIDVLLDPVDGDVIDDLSVRLQSENLWGPAMPLDSMVEMLTGGDNIWVAREGEIVPHLEVKFADDQFDRASLDNRLTARFAGSGAELPIGPLELQIAYKLSLGTRTDLEDAAHLYLLFEESLSTQQLEAWVRELDVEEEYDRLGDT